MKASIPGGGGRFVSSIAESAFAALVGFLVGGVVLALLGYNPFLTYYYMFYGALGSSQNVINVLSNAGPLILTALTFAIGVRAGLFNIGAEGQVYVGAAAAVFAGSLGLPAGANLLFILVFAGLAGAALSVPVFLLKAGRGVNEVISTIMLNWTAFFGILWISLVLLPDPKQPQETVGIPGTGRFPDVFSGSEVIFAFIFCCLVAFALYYYLWLTPSGYEVRAVGLNPEAARFSGISARKPLLYALLVGGVTSGMAGAVVVDRAPTFALYTSLTNVVSYGFNGIGVALIGKNHPLGIIVAGLFFGSLQAGYSTVQLYAHVPFEIIEVIEGIIIVAVAVPELYRRFRAGLHR